MSSEKFCYDLRTTSCCATPLKNANDELIGCIGVAANFKEMDSNIFSIILSAKVGIENQFRLQKHYDEFAVVSNYYRSIFNSVSDAIISIDNFGVICKVNTCAEKLINEKAENLVGRNIKDVLKFNPVLYDIKPNYFDNNRKYGLNYHNYKIIKEIPLIGPDGQAEGRTIFLGHNCKKNKPANANKAHTNTYTFDDLIGESLIFTNLKEKAKKAAQCDVNILITGDSGTGKELLAQSIHNASDRRHEPFVSVNCGAIPQDLIESEFFGYESGAFTGAHIKGKKGKFEQANGGTLFLDEIGEMPRDLQIRLLRVLQERKIVKLGGDKSISVDVRIIAATNKNIEQEVRMNNFRIDLYFRLNVVHLHMPKLVQRKQDIPLLANFFLSKYAINNHYQKVKIEKEALDMLCNYTWPGNVRQLENAIQYATIYTSDNTIKISNLPSYILKNDTIENKPLLDNEKHIILSTLKETGYNISQAATILNISRNTLYKKMKKYNIHC